MKRSRTELSLSAVAHLNQSVFLLVEEDFHSLDVPVHTCNTQHTTHNTERVKLPGCSSVIIILNHLIVLWV